jgi:hypothetical protein
MNYRIALSAITGLICLSKLCIAQNVLLEKEFSLKNKSVTIKTLSSKYGSFVLLHTDQSKDTISIKKKKGRVAIFEFINLAVRQQLQEIYSDANSPNIIQVFADTYSKLAIEKIFPTKGITKDQEITIENYILAKYLNGKNREYYVMPADLSEQPILILSKQKDNYLFHKAVQTHPVLVKNFPDLMGFIAKDTNITLPAFVYDKDTLTLNDGANAIKIAITTEQAEAWFGKEAVASGKPVSSLQAKPSSGKSAQISTNASEEKKNLETTLLSAQKIACSDKLEFELSALSTQRGTVDSFQVEINTAKDKKRLSLPSETGEIGFRREVKTQLIKDNCTTNIDSVLTIFYVKLTGKLEARKKELEEISKKEKDQKFRDSIYDRIAILGAEKEYAALLQCRKSIPLYTEQDKNVCGGSQRQEQLIVSGRKTLEVDSVVMRVSNNTVYQLDIVGKVDENPIQTLSNNSYGLSFRNLIDGNQQLYFKLDGHEYHFCYQDVFFARPTTDAVINYEIRDAVYRFYPDTPHLKSHRIEQKRLLDYVSASAFIDLLAFNAENTNKNLFTELYFNYHINPFNIHKGWGIFKNGYLPVSFGVNLFKEGLGMETFRGEEIIAIDSSVRPFDTITANKYYFKNLDLMRNAFLQIKPMINVLAFDAKKMRTIFEVNLGYLLMGSNARFTDPAKGVDSNFTRAIYSYSWATEARVRLNPRPRYGFDLHVMYSFGLRPFGTDYQSVTGNHRINDLGKAKQLSVNDDDFMLGELNFFFNPQRLRSDTDRGGLYFKLNWYKSMCYRDGHFMFLVGYSTDIKNFFR